jgi:hypothetical protein
MPNSAGCSDSSLGASGGAESEAPITCFIVFRTLFKCLPGTCRTPTRFPETYQKLSAHTVCQHLPVVTWIRFVWAGTHEQTKDGVLFRRRSGRGSEQIEDSLLAEGDDKCRSSAQTDEFGGVSTARNMICQLRRLPGGPAAPCGRGRAGPGPRMIVGPYDSCTGSRRAAHATVISYGGWRSRSFT